MSFISYLDLNYIKSDLEHPPLNKKNIIIKLHK